MYALRLAARSRVRALMTIGEPIEIFRSRLDITDKDIVITQCIALHGSHRSARFKQVQLKPLMPRRPHREIPSSGSRSRPNRGTRKMVLRHVAAAFVIAPPNGISACSVGEDSDM